MILGWKLKTTSVHQCITQTSPSLVTFLLLLLFCKENKRALCVSCKIHWYKKCLILHNILVIMIRRQLTTFLQRNYVCRYDECHSSFMSVYNFVQTHTFLCRLHAFIHSNRSSGGKETFPKYCGLWQTTSIHQAWSLIYYVTYGDGPFFISSKQLLARMTKIT